MKMTTRAKIGLILGTFFVLTIFAKKYIFCCIDDQGFLINLATEILGAIVTLFIVEKTIKDEEERQRQRLFSAAIKSLKNPLRRYTNMWLHISNSNEDEIVAELAAANSLRNYLLADTFIGKVQGRSFNDRYSEATILGTHDNRTLKEQVPKIQEQFISDINRVIGNYAHAFDPDTIVLLQHFAETAHLYGTFYFWKTVDIGDNRWFQQATADNIREHLIAFLNLMDKYNNSVPENEKWTKDNIVRLTRITGNLPNVKW
jgi:hypothetical protein